MSTAGGLFRAVERAEEVGATALQLFVKSARQWKARRLAAAEIDGFRAALERSGLGPYTLAHASYLINLASPDAQVRRRSIGALSAELRRCEGLAVPYLVLHPGSHVGEGEERGLARISKALDRVLREASARSPRPDCETRILLEVTAGTGSNLGHRFEQIGWLLDRAEVPERLGVCFDTCHALAAGYDFRDRRSYNKTFRDFDEAIGIERLEAFHLNDSKHDLGSRRDRHEHIGAGAVGLEAFRLILNDRRFRGLPMVLETPKGEDGLHDLENLRKLRAMLPARRR